MRTIDELQVGSQGVQEQATGVTVPNETETKQPKASVAKPKATKKAAKASKGKTASAAKAKAPKGKANGKSDKKVTVKSAKTAKPAKAGKTAKAEKPVAKVAKGKWPHDARNPFRAGSSYATCFNILAANRSGLTRSELVQHLAKAEGKDLVHAGYDCSVLMSAKPNEKGLSNNDSPRHRSCRSGFYIVRTGDQLKLMVD